MTTDNESLAFAALLWLRNHYDLASYRERDPDIRQKVIASIDLFLSEKAPNLSVSDCARFTHYRHANGFGFKRKRKNV